MKVLSMSPVRSDEDEEEWSFSAEGDGTGVLKVKMQHVMSRRLSHEKAGGEL